MPGWRRTILKIDLTAEKITKQPLDRLVAQNFIGGRVFNSLTLFKEVKPGIDPLGPENVLCLAPGALTGNGLALSSRTSSRGADHLRGRIWASGENNPKLVREPVDREFIPDVHYDPVRALTIGERVAAIADAIGRCKGAVISWAATVPLIRRYPLLEGEGKLLTTATGFEFSRAQLEEAAERIYIIERAFNIKQGI